MKKLLSLFLFPFLFYSCSNNSNIKATGNIEAYEESKIGSLVYNHIKKMYIEEGMKVQEDDLIAEINSTSLKIDQAEKTAILLQKQAHLNLLIAGARDEKIAITKDLLYSSKASLDYATTNYQRYMSLFENESATAAKKEEVTMQYQKALADYQALEEQLQEVENFTRPEQIEQGEASVLQAEAALNFVKNQINDCFIKAPINGTITYKPMQKGDIATQGSVLAVVSNLEKVKLTVYIAETDLGKVTLNQNVDVQIDSFPNHFFQGKIIFISPQSEFTPKNIEMQDQRTKLVYPIKILIDNPQGFFKIGMYATAFIKPQKP